MKKIFAFLAIATSAASPAFAIINGTLLDPAKFPQILSIETGSAKCSATIVGPRVLLTTAHCVQTGAIVAFTLGGVRYEAVMERSPSFNSTAHDLALGLIAVPVRNITPMTIGRRPVAAGDPVRLAGYGCTAVPSGAGAGQLRVGKSSVVSMTLLDFMAQAEPGGGALCWGDSGGPMFAGNVGTELVGVGSRGDLNVRSLGVRLDSRESELFFDDFVARHGVQICGVNTECPLRD